MTKRNPREYSSNIPNVEPLKKSQKTRCKLTLKQALFIREYIANGRNALQATIAAGYDSKQPDVLGAKILKSKLVAAELEKHTQLVAIKNFCTKDWTIEQAKKIYEEGGHDRVQGLKLIIDMLGYEAPKKTENKHVHANMDKDRKYIEQRIGELQQENSRDK